ncbi:undecaprenyl-phosphate 4-deoxy-4-formamido-L-arabinose transferase [Peptococcaceae bacterium CEB3]|nr:undecaprenyl-phosphate 4-deoxy-4-formamido-L-arabinose transferase [Peptococcaceae bacterium CEB3]
MDCLYIVMPAYNEAANIESVAREWHKVVAQIGNNSKLVIIDDGSRDDTYQKLCNLREDLPSLEPLTKGNSGHGATILYGYHYAIEKKADYIFQTDSDGQTLPSEFWSFWEQRDKFVAVIGHRNHRKDGVSRILVTKVLKIVLRLSFGLNIADANTPFRLIEKQTLKKYVARIPDNFNLSNVILTVLLISGKEKVRFIPITFRPRQGGVNSINLRRIIKIGAQAIKDFRDIRNQLLR